MASEEDDLRVATSARFRRVVLMRTVRLNKMALFERVGYNPHIGQRRVHNSVARHRVNAAGRRFGKSRVGGMELLPYVYASYFNRAKLEDLGIRMEYWIVGPNYTDSEKEFRVLWEVMRRLKMPLDKPGSYYDPKGNMSVSLWGGRFIAHAKSGKHPDSLVGEGLHGVIMGEAAKMKERIWVKSVRPMLTDFQGWSLWNSTPEGRNYFHRLWQRGQDPADTEWASWRQASWVNPYVFPLGKDDPEIKSQRADLGEESFKQEIECSFTEFVGQVFKDWDEEVHVRDLGYNPGLPVYIATDYGYTDPNVALFIQVSPFQDVYVIGEYYRTHRTDEEFAEDILKDDNLRGMLQGSVRIYPDPADPGATRTLSDRWKVRAAPGTGGPIKNRIKLIQKWLKIPQGLEHLPWGHPERMPKLLVDRRCVNLIREMDSYRYPDRTTKSSGKGPESPMDGNDHAPEALGRFFAGHIGGGPGGRPVVKAARVGQ